MNNEAMNKALSNQPASATPLYCAGLNPLEYEWALLATVPHRGGAFKGYTIWKPRSQIILSIRGMARSIFI
jgi:hypothetical protein